MTGAERRQDPERTPGAGVSARRYPTGAELLAEATAEAGLTDFGPGDFREGLDVLLDSL
jgi:hypothetical protein